MAHSGRRSVHAPDGLAGGTARPQATRRLHRVASHRREYTAQRWLRLFGQWNLFVVIL